jgi:ubiquinone/menaquinone biosynthesis C-methylase UbiE
MDQRETVPADHKQRVQAQFGAAADRYVASATHAGGDDLAQLVAWAEGGPDRRALDVATGGGHTALALAPLYGEVVASDLTEAMLHSAEGFIRGRGVENVRFRQADAERLPFADASFDLVSCRIAPHHFPDVAAFVAEVARVLRLGGLFLLEDSLAPDDPAAATFLNAVEKQRDPTHVRSLGRTEWLALLDGAGLRVEAEGVLAKTHPFVAWVERSDTPPAARASLTASFAHAPPAIRAALGIVLGPDGEVTSYTDQKLLVKARKGGPGGPASSRSI